MAKKKIHLVAEGDSWFAFPDIFSFKGGRSGNILSSFQNIQEENKGNVKYLLVGLGGYGSGAKPPANGSGYAYRGHTIENMVNYEKKKELLTAQLKQTKAKVKGMIFSAGGNDLINKMPSFLNNNDGSNNYFNAKLDLALDKIEAGYEYFIKLCADHGAKLITHTYYPPDPTKGGACFFFVCKNPWIKPVLKKKGYTNINVQKNICKIMIDKFENRLQKIAKEEYSTNNFYYVDLRSLRSLQDRRYDEIHLNIRGCNKVAKKFEEKLNTISF